VWTHFQLPGNAILLWSASATALFATSMLQSGTKSTTGAWLCRASLAAAERDRLIPTADRQQEGQ
jgi:hypothetical protein